MGHEQAPNTSFRLSRRDVLLSAVGMLAAGVGLSVRDSLAGSVTTDEHGDRVQTVPRGELPEFVRGKPDAGRLYRFATEHAGDLEYIPCFCGCKDIGHRSNRDCYIKSFNRDGSATYTSHAST